MPGHGMPLPAFVRPTARDHRIARDVVDSHPVVSAYGSSDWNELHDDGREWMAAVVREAQVRAALSADGIVHANAFLTHMAERFRERTARRVFGIRVWVMPREQAMLHALVCFDQAVADIPFGDPDGAWDQGGAHALVDEELSYWEA